MEVINRSVCFLKGKWMRNLIVAGVAAGLLGASGVVLGKVTAKEAEALGQELTPVGAEREGNAAGTIPAWTGGLSTPPEGWRKGRWKLTRFRMISRCMW